jgi:two-component system phosphate regulon response regulator PhoB
MASERILVIDDAEGMRNLLGLSLVQEGFQLFFADCGQAGLAAMVREFPDAVILDLTLPDMDGLEVCRLLKDNPATALVPILMLTGRCEEADVIRGLEMGADDYLIKPCSPRVLCARLRAVLRRRNGEGNTGAALLQLHDLVIDPAKGEVRSGEASIGLTFPEFRFLQLLVSAVLAADGQPDPGLRASLAEDQGTDSLILEREGMALFALNRLGKVAALLRELPDPVLCRHPWLAFFGALCRLQVDGPDPRPPLEAARDGFVANGSVAGELLACAQLLHLQTVFAGQHPDTPRLLKQAEELSRQVLSDLSPYSQIQVAQCLAVTALLCCGNLPVAARYTDRALALVDQYGMAGVGLGARFGRGYQLLRKGDLAGVIRELEIVHPLLNHPQVNPIDRALLRLLQLQVLFLNGDEINWKKLRASLPTEIDRRLLERSLLHSALVLHDATVALRCGRHQEALEICRRWWGAESEPIHDLWRYRCLGLSALAAARGDHPEKARRSLQAAMELLPHCDDSYERSLGNLLLGAAAAVLGDWEASGALLTQAWADAVSLGNGWLMAAIQGQRAVLAEATRTGDAAAELDHWLSLTTVPPVAAVFPLTIRCLLEACLHHRREAEPATRRMANALDLAISDTGELIPRLEIRTLGGCTFFLEGRRVLRAEDLTPAQRELIAVLVAVPGMKLSQEEVQLDFWPDSPPEKARSSFDSLLLRLRKTVDQALAPHSIRNYLVLQKGMLCLQNVRVDAHAFRALARRGLEYARRREHWQAENAFARRRAAHLALYPKRFRNGLA